MWEIWLIGALVTAGLAVGAWAWWRPQGRTARTVSRLEPDWEQRAVKAEERANQAETVIRAGLLPYLSRLLKSRFVLGLISQRSRLLETQDHGSKRVTDLEERLAAAQTQLKSQIETYERRIDELENQAGVKEKPEEAPAAPAARKNPLQSKPVAPEPAPMQFADIMARKRAEQGGRGTGV